MTLRDAGPALAETTSARLRVKTERLRLAPASPRPVAERDRRYVLGVLRALLLTTLLGQRLVVPLGADNRVSLPLLVAYVAGFLLLLRGALVSNRVRTELYVTALIVLVASAAGANWLGNTVSLNSLLLLLVLYLPWVFCVAPRFRDLFVPVLGTFVTAMTGCAVLGGGQMVAQLLLGWTYTDYLQQWLGPNWLDLTFNTENTLAWNNPLVKANAFVFLEPSFLCQFCALALVAALLIRAPAWQQLVLGLGMAATLSGTGILLLVLGTVLILLRAPNRIQPRVVVAGGICLTIVFLTPAAGILLDRRDEASQSGSSGSLRFVQPYTGVIAGLQQDPSRYLVGAGPGASDRLLASTRSGGEAVVYAIAPKLAFEYGLLSLVVFMAFLLVAVLRGPPIPVLPATTLFMMFFLSGSLLSPHVIITAWLLTSVWGTPVTVGISDGIAAARRRARAVTASQPSP